MRLFSCPSTPEPVHVGKPGQHVGCLAEVAVLLVVAPQQVHVVHFALVLLDHVHEVILQIRGVYLEIVTEQIV